MKLLLFGYIFLRFFFLQTWQPINQVGSNENKKCLLMNIARKKRVVVEG